LSRPRILRRRQVGPAPRGQSLAEFALVVPILLLLVLGVADFGRLFNAEVAVESAAREAADYGAFKSSYWTVDAAMSVNNPPITVAEMQRRACTAAAGSHLEGYAEPGGTINHASCTNPTFECWLVPPGGSEVPCATYPGGACADSTTDPSCIVHVRLSYTFKPFFAIPPIPASLQVVRDSRFAISDLVTP
jgi:hypothetical protein